MREILFRGKRIDNGEWVYGNYCAAEYYMSDGIEHLIIEVPKNGVSEKIVPETVGQYTGLTDTNGKKIFEGDIVRLYLDDSIVIGPIMWSYIDLRYKFASPDGTAYGVDCTCVFEVIGNIYDNPELLKGGAE